MAFQTTTAGRVAGALLLLIGLGVLAMTWRQARQVPLTAAGNPWTLGVVESEGLVRFTDVGGESYQVGAPGCTVGDTVTIEMPAGYPEEAGVIARPPRSHQPVLAWVTGFVLASLGLMCLLLGRAKN